MSLGYVCLFYQSMLKVLLEMERKALIKEDDLSMLKDILKGFRADIQKKIVAFEEQKKGKLFNLLFKSRASVCVSGCVCVCVCDFCGFILCSLGAQR